MKNLKMPYIKTLKSHISSLDIALSEVKLRYDSWDTRLGQLNDDIEELQWKLRFSSEQAERSE